MTLRVAVLGAGSVGAWFGARLARAGAEVVLIGRPRLAEAAERAGIEVASLGQRPERVAPGALPVSTDCHVARGADVVLVTVKGGDTARAAAQLRPHLAEGVAVVSLQNGLRNADRLRDALPDVRVVAGLVGFNVVWDEAPDGAARFRQATSGPVVLEAEGAPALCAALRAAGVPALQHPDMIRVQWAKLLLNLNNAINALCGLGLREQLLDPSYRAVLAAAMREGWRALDAAGIRPAPVGRMRPRLAPHILPLPTPLFRLLAAPLIRIDPEARSSMADDLRRGRPTEIDDINGEVVALGDSVDVPTPVNRCLVAQVRAAEAARASPRLPASALWGR